MGKDFGELAGDIMVAWLSAIGSANGGDTSSASLKAQKILSDQETVAGFYEKILRAIRKAYKTPVE